MARTRRHARESEFSTGRSNGRRDTTDPYREERGALCGNPGPTVTPPATSVGGTSRTYRGTIASDTMAEAVESQARLLSRPPTAPLPRKRTM